MKQHKLDRPDFALLVADLLLVMLLVGSLLAGASLGGARDVALAQAPSASPLQPTYDLLWWTVDGGGVTFSEGGGYTLNGTVGQPDAAVLIGSKYTLAGGFWGSTVAAARYLIHLPRIAHDWPPVPDTPTMNAISNTDGDGAYTVGWSGAEGAETYVLEEAINSAFTGAAQVYTDTATSYDVSGKGPTRYYYRVKGRNSWGDSSWSNSEWTDVVWELEPNDVPNQANGVIVSGVTYYSTLPMEDTNDYFYFDLSASGSVELWLTQIPGDCDFDLVLRDAGLDIVGYSGNVGNADEHILTGTLSPGRYYAQVHRRGTVGSTQVYHVQAVYP